MQPSNHHSSITIKTFQNVYSQLNQQQAPTVKIQTIVKINSTQSLQYNATLSDQLLIITEPNSQDITPFLKIKLQQVVTYRLSRLIQNNLWKLSLRLNYTEIQLFSQSYSFSEGWDQLLSKKVCKSHFHLQFKPIRILAKRAKVYQVSRVLDGKQFAVKAFPKKNLQQQPKKQKSLDMEISILRLFTQNPNENIISLTYLYQSQNILYLVMPLYSGGTLLDKIKYNPSQLTEQVSKHITYKILQGLAHMHSKNIVHRDIKPENILFKQKNGINPVIADFGLATSIHQENYLFTRCGTPGYVAPQIIQALPDQKLFNTQSDIFSLGALLYLMLTGRPLFHAEDPSQMLQRNKEMKLKLQLQQKAQNAVSLLQKMLEPDPYKRISAQQALKDRWFINEEKEQMNSTIPTEATTMNHFKLQMEVQQKELENIPKEKKRQYRKASHF